MILEVCCGTLASALAAVEGGATRIELCSALSLDGLTPSVGTIRELRRRFPELRIHVLIRPREGNFVYSDAEVQVMLHDIRAAVDAGATAIVSGALTAEGELDVTTTARLIKASGGLPFTFHRAFDVIQNQSSALRLLQGLGVARVLTSGGAATAKAGIPALHRLVQEAAAFRPDAVVILPGGGVNRHNARQIIDETGATEIHGSCSVILPNGLRQTSAAEVREIMKCLSCRR